MNSFKIQKFLFSNKNILGCGIASVMIVLALLGILKAFWLPITVMGYIFGYIAGPVEKQIKFYHFAGQDLSDYIGFINKLKNTVDNSAKLPSDAKTIVNSISQNATELLTFLKDTDKNYSLTEDLVNFTSIFDSYLPKIINQYEKLPSKYANEIKSSNGKTAKQMLVEQLSVLDKKVQEIAYGMYEDDVTALRANGHFLKEKFGKTNLFELEINA
jgi:hypothetical protein